MDAKLLIAEVAKRHGILLDANDPVLVTVTLNELVLEEYLRRLSAAVEQGERRAVAASERQLAMAKQAAGEIVTRTAAYVADQVRAAAAEARSEIEQRVAGAATSVRADASAAARHRNLAFVFMMASALASALALSGVAM
ncbi:hypothetical protein [Anaeromyxobacter diazotrophicus]|uniref:Transcriptional activator TraM n=1 Tax=Anaeromyxobacter diazotrophicus TaxID=2590199 RepID=A0A7I9VJS0_9BACT|nr:hypothetical protein [Anaeromyxobacter diazotrophicus]GEJ56623.1 hypothetical protein AMYX_13640 [Anaeromyxobacter diazotrophicus]